MKIINSDFVFISENHDVTYYELPSMYGHDTFLLDVVAVGAAVKVSHVVKFEGRCVLNAIKTEHFAK